MAIVRALWPPSRPADPPSGAARRQRWTTAGTTAGRAISELFGESSLASVRGLLNDGVHVRARQSVRRDRRPAGMLTSAGHAVFACGTKSSVSRRARSSGRRVKCRFCGTTPCCSDSIAFISPRGACGRLGMPEVRLDGSQRTGAVGAVELGQARELDGITDGGAGAVGLDKADAARRPLPPPPTPTGTPRPVRRPTVSRC